MLWPAQMRAAEEPLWEAGVGIGALGLFGTAARPAYEAAGGYAGTKLLAASSERVATSD